MLLFSAMSSTTQESTANLAAQAWENVAEVMHSNRPRFMALCREFDLFPPQMLVLKSLDAPKPMREVADWLACDTSNLTGIIDRLEERDLVKRTASPTDRRVKLLVLTKEGRRLHKEIAKRMHTPPPEIASLPAADLRALRDIMRRANEIRESEATEQ
jgi:DNA-binding MarR family transcriptional regulator